MKNQGEFREWTPLCACTEYEKYQNMLLMDQIRLPDVPMELLRTSNCMGLYVTAFRADRGISTTRYEQDLLFLRSEILLAEMRREWELKKTLETTISSAQSVPSRMIRPY